MDDIGDLSLKAARFQRWLSVATVIVALFLILECMSDAGFFADTAAIGDSIPRLALELVYAIPAMVYLAALWRIRATFASVAQGALFAPIVAKTLRQVGFMVTVGAGITILVMPMLHRFFGDSYPRLIEFDISSIALGALGIGIVCISKLFDRAQPIQSELEEIF